MFENDWTRRVEELEAEVREKDSIIRALKEVNEERLQIIERLHQEGYEEKEKDDNHWQKAQQFTEKYGGAVILVCGRNEEPCS